MNDFKTPAHKRKNRSPLQKKDRVNEFVIGKHSAVKLVASIERAGHQTVVSQLKMIRRTAVLTSEQAKAVQEELAWRQEQCANLTRIIENSQRAIDFQCAKPSGKDRPRTAVIVPGPNGSKTSRLTGERSNEDAKSTTTETATGRVHMLGDHQRRQQATVSLKVTAAPASWFPGLSHDANEHGGKRK